MVNDETIIVASLMKMLGKDTIEIPENMVREVDYIDIIVHKKYMDENHISYTIEKV